MSKGGAHNSDRCRVRGARRRSDDNTAVCRRRRRVAYGIGVVASAMLCIAFAQQGCGSLTDTDGPGMEAGFASTGFNDPQTCGACHPTHLREWEGSIMHYAAMSPVFNAFEMTVRKLTEGAFAANGEQPNFCIQCHSPTGVFNDELPDFVDSDSVIPARDSLSLVSQNGLSCDFCHTVTGPDIEGSLLGDGIANMSLEFAPSDVKVGPIDDPVESAYHESTGSSFIRASEFCGACHDVRIPKPDVVTGEPFQRLENLFTEWKTGPYATEDNPFGRVVRCQDCHMSLYPQTEPGVFPTMAVGVGVDVPERPHAIHAFTAVSVPFMDDVLFPNVDTDGEDEWGFPLGQQQRRTQMLRAACTLTLEGTPTSLDASADVIPIRAVVTNSGTGHNVPSGFSQERQVWIELIVRDDVGVIYESGYLRDKAHPDTGELEPDGLLDDEDLDDRHFTVDIDTLDTHFEPGPDRDQRPEVNLGMMNFQNAFLRIHPDGTREPVINPLLADTMDNSRSLAPLASREVLYDVLVPPRGIVGDVRVTARLRYRAFPPEFLRILAVREPQLVSEETVDLNTIVDMAEAEATISVP
jgi:eukaryotic-like serine/threonine-protein kinase